MKTIFPAILVFLLEACGSSSTPPGTDAPASRPEAAARAQAEKRSHGWPVLGDLQPLCNGNVIAGDGSEISWDLFSSPRPPRDVADDYVRKLGGELLEEAQREWIWRAPNAERPERVLGIEGADRPLQDCPAPPPGTNTIANFSEIHRAPQ